jgi:hypothetical protein
MRLSVAEAITPPRNQSWFFLLYMCLFDAELYASIVSCCACSNNHCKRHVRFVMDV